MVDDITSLEIIWDGLLSTEPDRVKSIYCGLNNNSRLEMVAHLKRMAIEEGWHPKQQAAAQAALDYIQKLMVCGDEK